MLRQKRFLERLQPRMAFLSTLWVKHFVPRRKHLGRTLGDVTILAVESWAVLMTVVYSHHKDLTRVGVTITVGPSTLQQKTSKPLRIPLKTYQDCISGGFRIPLLLVSGEGYRDPRHSKARRTPRIAPEPSRSPLRGHRTAQAQCKPVQKQDRQS